MYFEEGLPSPCHPDAGGRRTFLTFISINLRLSLSLTSKHSLYYTYLTTHPGK